MLKLFNTLLICTVFFLFLKSDCCNRPSPQICIQINPESCPGANLTNALLHLNEWRVTRMYMSANGQLSSIQDATHFIPIDTYPAHPNHLISAGFGEEAGGEDYIDGYEINYGFWSKDSYRKYTWADMFFWKNGRQPTPAELAVLTCDQIKQWYNERHTVERSWPFPDDPPRDVRCIREPFRKYCVTLNSGTYMNEYDGEVTFANGKSCRIEKFDLKRDTYDGCNNPHNYKVNIKKPCSECP